MSSLPIHSPSRRVALIGGVVFAHAALLLFLGTTRARQPVAPDSMIEAVLLAPQPLPEARVAAVSRAATPTPPPRPQSRPKPSPTPPSAATSLPASAAAILTTTSTQATLPSVTESTGASDGKSAATTSATGTPSGHGEAREAASAARFDADYLKNPPPPYPPQSRRLGEEGKVILRVQVSADGQAQNVEIRTSSGSPRLDESAQRTVRGWRFVPAKRGDTPVESWVLVPIVFKLEQ